MNTQEKNEVVPLWERMLLTFPEASVLSGIGVNKLRSIAKEPDCEFIIWIGDRKMIKREKFQEYLLNAYSL